MQTILFLAHWLIYLTLNTFWQFSPTVSRSLGVGLFLLSISFTVAAMLAFRLSNPLVAFLYRLTAIWLGFLNFAVWAACLSWVAALLLWFAPADLAAHLRPWIGVTLFSVALITAIYGLVNARNIRKRRLTITLPNLPSSWRGRTALLVSDLHLGNVNGAGFARRIARLAQRLRPDLIFIAGDLYDGTRADPHRLAAPLFELAPPLGTFFSGGNHEEFGDAASYEATLRDGGIQVLHNERVDVEGVQIIGVPYADTTHPPHFRSFLDNLSLDPDAPSILLNHVPSRLAMVEQAGVSLQLSGHTHGGQVPPFTWITRHVYGKFSYGLQRFGRLQVLTSSGVGTWGPPMRVGSAPEVVLITFA
ncbi:MAG TPA: metallophosphoesterase [Terracidiphilus sp.]|nr:metallophosphoesterase [Terracidiphilus sp.]